MLLFVLRDKTRTPLPRLVETLETDLAKMWDTIRKPTQYKDSLLTDFFEVGLYGAAPIGFHMCLRASLPNLYPHCYTVAGAVCPFFSHGPRLPQVQYAGLSHFEEKYEDFLADTVVLRRRFTPDGRCGCGGWGLVVGVGWWWVWRVWGWP